MPTIEICRVEFNAKYTLRYRGGETIETFPTIEKAVLHAGEIVVQETRLVIMDNHEKEMVVTTLAPLSTD